MAFVSASFGISIGFLPVNIFPTLHYIVTIMFSLFFASTSIILAVLIKLDNQFSNRYSTIIFFYSILLILYIIIVMIGPDTTIDLGLFINATGQKIVIFSGFFCIILAAFGSLMEYRIRILQQ